LDNSAEISSLAKREIMLLNSQQKSPSTDKKLCSECLNLTSVFDGSVETSRDIDKEGASHINHHRSLTSLLKCSQACPLCALVIHAVPYQEEWLLWEIVKDILTPWYVDKSIDSSIWAVDRSMGASMWDVANWLGSMLLDWQTYLTNLQEASTRPVLENRNFPRWTKQYKETVISLSLSEDTRLVEVLSMMQKEVGPNFGKPLKITNWTQAIRIREQFAVKGQFANLALYLQSDTGTGLQTLSSGNLRIASCPSKLLLSAHFTPLSSSIQANS
jgi:hypothetical protein